MEYSFNVEVAEKYGVNIAIVLKNFQFWILKNKANDKHSYEGRTWTYNSISALSKLFPFWETHQIRYIIDKAVELEILIKGNFNKKGYDHTTWYAFKNEEDFLSTIDEISQDDVRKVAERCEKSRRPIPDINTDINTEEKKHARTRKKVTDDSMFNKFWEVYDFKIGKYASQKIWDKMNMTERTKALEQSLAYVDWVMLRYGDMKYKMKPENYLKKKIFLEELVLTPTEKPVKGFRDYKGIEEI
jgi:hypothetical protein